MGRPQSIFAAIMLLCSAGFCVRADAATVAIVHPPDLAVLEGSGSLDLLGWNGGKDALSVLVKGADGAREYRGGTGAFTLNVTLSPGVNTIEIGERSARVFLVGKGEKAPPTFSPADPHAVDNACEDCHAFEGGAITLQEPAPGLCARCHDDMLKDKTGKAHAVPHPPADEGDCLSCHVFHRRSIKLLPAGAKRELCFGCHDDFTGGGKKRLHAPVAAGDCTGCHGAHGGAGKALLPASGVKLCLLCHADPSRKKDGGEWPQTHPALDDGCAACHLHHVADNPGLLKKSQAEVCADCHDPFPTEEGGKQLVIHTPVEEGECAGCHAVHGSDAKKLLAAEGTALCEMCHTDPSTNGGEEWATPHPALDDGCPSCHQAHVAAAPQLLAKPERELCAGCHEDKNLDADGVEWTTPHEPVRSGLCASCHGVHGAAVKGLLTAPPIELCMANCHTEIHPNHRSTEIDPATDQPVKTIVKLPRGFPVRRKDGVFDCTGCHQPHGSAHQDMWNKTQEVFCVQCHQF